ncbi:MAG: histidine phosphatase family protein [Thermomicrobiales bacterium]|jgi:phosphohistidine phosphatase|nr:MAG: histidine phosphatase family protein [Thermomicrobiales bacterium]
MSRISTPDAEVREVTELYVLRHAHAGDPSGWTGDDDDRPLSDKGERQAERLGRFLERIGFVPDAIISSPKTRAAQTAEILAAQLGVEYSLDPRLAGEVEVATVDDILRDARDPARLVIVGHDPDFSDLVGQLSGATGITMRKGSMARIDVVRPLAAGRAAFRWLLPPDLLKPDH